MNSFVRGYHAPLSIWDSVVREEFQLEREPENMEDQRAVAAKKTVRLSINSLVPRHPLCIWRGREFWLIEQTFLSQLWNASCRCWYANSEVLGI